MTPTIHCLIYSVTSALLTGATCKCAYKPNFGNHPKMKLSISRFTVYLFSKSHEDPFIRFYSVTSCYHVPASIRPSQRSTKKTTHTISQTQTAQRPSRSFTYFKPCQVELFTQSCSSWRVISLTAHLTALNSAIAEALVEKSCCQTIANKTSNLSIAKIYKHKY